MRVRFCLMILAMLSLALLPGPAHALAHESQPAVTSAHLSVHHHHEAAADGVMHHDHHRGSPGHHHGAVCDAACCGAMCSIYAPPMMAASRIGHAQAAPLPTSDRPRPDADMSRSLRPPEHA